MHAMLAASVVLKGAALTRGLSDCAGSIVNAPLGNRYLLTADHCLRGELKHYHHPANMIKDAQMACSAVIFCSALTAPAIFLLRCEPGLEQSGPLLAPTLCHLQHMTLTLAS